jgi:hypothetical protein
MADFREPQHEQSPSSLISLSLIMGWDRKGASHSTLSFIMAINVWKGSDFYWGTHNNVFQAEVMTSVLLLHGLPIL